MHFVEMQPLPLYSESIICNSSDYHATALAYWLGFRKVNDIGNYVAVRVNLHHFLHFFFPFYLFLGLYELFKSEFKSFLGSNHHFAGVSMPSNHNVSSAAQAACDRWIKTTARNCLPGCGSEKVGCKFIEYGHVLPKLWILQIRIRGCFLVPICDMFFIPKQKNMDIAFHHFLHLFLLFFCYCITVICFIVFFQRLSIF